MTTRAARAVLISIDPWTMEDCETRPFNYAIRKVQAAALADPTLSDWELHVLDFRDADVDAFQARIEALAPDFIGASTYVWSFPTFVELARRIKASRPDVCIVFGGPSARSEMFALAPFRDAVAAVDALVLGEGEDTFRQILALPERSRAALRGVPGLAVSTGTDWFVTAGAPLPQLDSLASPYVLKLVGGDPSDRRATGHLETFRGCPLSCTFCQWGDLSASNRAFSTEYLVRELAAFQDSFLPNAFIIDAALNLNARAFRNLLAADREVGYFRDGHLNCEVYPSHVTDEHLQFIAGCRDATIGIGLQSLDKQVLDGVERPFDEARFRRVVKEIVSIAPRSTLELIVGLPGDSPASFRETLDRVQDLGCGVRVYRCLVLPNALMSRAPASFQMEFDPITLRMHSCLGWSREDLDRTLRELSEMVAATEGAMSFDEGNTFAFRAPSAATEDEKRANPPRDHRTPIEVAANARVQPAPSNGGHATPADDRPREHPVDPSIHDQMANAIQRATSGAWTLVTAANQPGCLLLRVTVAGAPERAIEVRQARGDAKAFCVVDGLAFSYLDNGTPLSRADQQHFNAAARALRRLTGLAVPAAPPTDSPQVLGG